MFPVTDYRKNIGDFFVVVLFLRLDFFSQKKATLLANWGFLGFFFFFPVCQLEISKLTQLWIGLCVEPTIQYLDLFWPTKSSALLIFVGGQLPRRTIWNAIFFSKNDDWLSKCQYPLTKLFLCSRDLKLVLAIRELYFFSTQDNVNERTNNNFGFVIRASCACHQRALLTRQQQSNPSWHVQNLFSNCFGSLGQWKSAETRCVSRLLGEWR